MLRAKYSLDRARLVNNSAFLTGLGLMAIIVGQICLSIGWIKTDRFPPVWDAAWYLTQGATQLESLKEGLPQWYGAWLSLDRTRPSLVPTLLMPAFALLGVSTDAGLYVNLLATCVLILTTFMLATDIADNRVGLLAAALVGSYPMTQGLAHILLVEYVMVMFVALTLLALYRSDGFRRPGWSAATGILLGLGMLTKVFFVVFVVAPLVFTVWLALKRRAGISNIFLCGILALMVAAWWYIPNFSVMLNRSIDTAVGTEGAPYGPANPLNWRSLLGYFLNLVGRRISVLGFLLFLASLVGFIRKQRSIRADYSALPFLFSSIAGAYLVFSSISNQDVKHIAGIMPAMAVVTAWGVSNLTTRPQYLILPFAAFYSIAGSFPGPLEDFRPRLSIGQMSLYLFYGAQPEVDITLATAKPDIWPTDEILDYGLLVSGIARIGKPVANIAVIPDQLNLEPYSLLWRSVERDLPVHVELAYPHSLWNQDVLIHKTGDPGFPPRQPTVRSLEELLIADESEFNLMPRTIPLPDGSEAMFYARIESPLLVEQPDPEFAVNAQFEDIGRLLGIDIHWQDRSTLETVYYWETINSTDTMQTLFVHFIKPETDEIIFQDDHPLFPFAYPTSMWQPGRKLFDNRIVSVPSDFKGHELLLRVGLYDDTGRRIISAPESLSGHDSIDVYPVSLP